MLTLTLGTVAVAGLGLGAELGPAKPPFGNRHDMHVAMLRVLVAHGKPVDAAPEVLFELAHHLLRPGFQVDLMRRVLVLGVRRQHQAVDVVVLVHAIDARVRGGFADPAVSIPYLSVLAFDPARCSGGRRSGRGLWPAAGLLSALGCRAESSPRL